MFSRSWSTEGSVVLPPHRVPRASSTTAASQTNTPRREGTPPSRVIQRPRKAPKNNAQARDENVPPSSCSRTTRPPTTPQGSTRRPVTKKQTAQPQSSASRQASASKSPMVPSTWKRDKAPSWARFQRVKRSLSHSFPPRHRAAGPATANRITQGSTGRAANTACFS